MLTDKRARVQAALDRLHAATPSGNPLDWDEAYNVVAKVETTVEEVKDEPSVYHDLLKARDSLLAKLERRAIELGKRAEWEQLKTKRIALKTLDKLGMTARKRPPGEVLFGHYLQSQHPRFEFRNQGGGKSGLWNSQTVLFEVKDLINRARLQALPHLLQPRLRSIAVSLLYQRWREGCWRISKFGV